MSGHQRRIGHGAVADAVARRSQSRWGVSAGHRQADRGGPAQGELRTGRNARGNGDQPRRQHPEFPARPTPDHQLAPPTAGARLPPPRARWQRSDATKSQ